MICRLNWAPGTLSLRCINGRADVPAMIYGPLAVHPVGPGFAVSHVESGYRITDEFSTGDKAQRFAERLVAIASDEIAALGTNPAPNQRNTEFERKVKEAKKA